MSSGYKGVPMYYKGGQFELEGVLFLDNHTRYDFTDSGNGSIPATISHLPETELNTLATKSIHLNSPKNRSNKLKMR